jgi:hypothetical protein
VRGNPHRESVARDRKKPPVERREARLPDRKGGPAHRRRQVCPKAVCRVASPATHGVSQSPVKHIPAIRCHEKRAENRYLLVV